MLPDGGSGAVEGADDAVPAAVPWSRGSSFVLPGVWGGLLLTWASFTPSLLPRGPVTQGIIAGISAAVGYGIGVLVAYVWRALVDREARDGGRSLWIATGLIGAMGTGVALVLGRIAQGRILDLRGAPTGALWRMVLTPILGVGLFMILLAVHPWLFGGYPLAAL